MASGQPGRYSARKQRRTESGRFFRGANRAVLPETHRRGQQLQSEARNAKNTPESAICGVLRKRPTPTGSVLWLVPISNPRSAPRRVGRTNLPSDLQTKGVRCWFAPEDLKIGDKFRTEIDRAIRVHDKLLLLLSANSILSDWVEKEVETAFDRERHDKRTVLFPIRLDDTIVDAVDGWAADIRRTRHIGDFTNWKDHDSYQTAFERLLRDLKASTK